KRRFDLPNAVETLRTAREPGFGQRRRQGGTLPRRDQLATQALELGQGHRSLRSAPGCKRLGRTEGLEALEAGLLRFNQVQQGALARPPDCTGSERRRTRRPLLAGELLALHEVEQR